MSKYLIIDTANTFFRCKHTAGKHTDTNTKIGLSLHVTMTSVAKMWRMHDVGHVVFCLEGSSWRKKFYEPYKKNRVATQLAKSDRERDEDEMFWEAHNDLVNFLSDHTNCTVLQHNQLEADDLIAGFVQNHPNDEHIIISGDSDFYQLLAPNIKQYSGTTEQLITSEGIFDKVGNRVVDKKTKKEIEIDPEWLLFEKCIRGDTSDNVFSAYPGVRKKGSKNSVGLLEAFDDRNSKGYNWNNLMLQRWTDHQDKEHKVKDDYERNKQLIDLTAQPDDIREIIDDNTTQILTKTNGSVGIHFIRFCGKWELNKLAENASQFGPILNARYG